jgi:hypothetical protein
VVLLGIDVAIPDAVPILDELVLGLLAVTFATWKKKRVGHGSSNRRGVNR